MKIDCIADCHGYRPELDGGDLLIVAGDLTAKHTINEWGEFLEWLAKQDYRKIIFIAGNHDTFIEKYLNCRIGDVYDLVKSFNIRNFFKDKIVYLQDQGIEFEGLKIWGSPWSPWFKGVNPNCKAFMKKDTDLLEKWELIPDDIDILITHCPPFGVLDAIKMEDGSDFHVGSGSLRTEQLTKCTIKERFPKLWVFGHIHEGYGKAKDRNFLGTIFVNASVVNERYEHVNKPIRIEI